MMQAQIGYSDPSPRTEQVASRLGEDVPVCNKFMGQF